MVYPLTDGRWSTYTAVQGSQSHSQPADYNSDGVTIILPMSCHVLSLREEEECLAAWTSSLHWRPSPALFVALIIFNPVQSSMSWIRFPLGLPLPLLPDVAPTILSLFTESPLDLSVSIKTIIGPRSSPHTQEEWLLSIHILQKSSCLPFLLPRNSQKCDVPSLKMRGFYSACSSSKSNYFAPICCCQRECWYYQATLVIKAILLSSIIDLLKYSKPFRISLFSMCLRKEDRC